ncbi:TolC family protein [Tuwongella immobilis]|uniref:Outer membrane efflux protein n=1 Tax=Tuwongella immobilis TaxID=692036 RepID=A0A6C2YQX6_9BACT|nr:TolC family protein [Tuwongella immobilis]VIP03804.1 outer membrane efflux protein : Outer membrane efflux protein OS=Rhodopirellula europaea 6C GN=RE6C_02590 PE=4 SV=1: OEP [Tuwongella immobilis]VTS04975.1 outer membrane efflux protein : Outer membrane efflux protein OS=Rhodopirellula europaea 6C GN=RE6C_02590 PE=4 SV=1: OEP [Tuwongella immobilis]
MMGSKTRSFRRLWPLAGGIAFLGTALTASSQSPPAPVPNVVTPIDPDPYGLVGAVENDSKLTTPFGTQLNTVESMPIDLVTVLQLADLQNPTNGRAQARVRQALAQVDQARILLLPNIVVGANYFRHDGIDQNRRGDIFRVSRSNTWTSGAFQLRLDLSDAIYQPLIAKRVRDAAVANAQSVRNQVQLDAALLYLDLMQLYAQLAINEETIVQTELMLERARTADAAGLSKAKGDINRAVKEFNVRRQERRELKGRIGAASAKLGRVLQLDSTVDLRPIDPVVVPIQLVPGQPFENLIALALGNRPEIAESQALRGAADERYRLAQYQPLIPKVAVGFSGGGFAGGRNAQYSDFDGQDELSALLFWEFRNLGFGNRVAARERQAVVDEATYRVLEVQAQVKAEVLEFAKLATARFRTLNFAQEAVRQATELYRRLLESQQNLIGPRATYDALEPLLAIQSLNQTRTQYLNEVMEFNRAQFRLFTALGQPAIGSIPGGTPIPVAVPVVPQSPLAPGQRLPAPAAGPQPAPPAAGTQPGQVPQAMLLPQVR